MELIPLKCPRCGHETVVEVKFCPSCGLEMAAQAEPATPAEQTPAEAPPAATPPVEPGIVTIPLAIDQPAAAAPPPMAPPPAPAIPPPAPPVIIPTVVPVVTPPVAAAPPVAPAAPPPAPPVGQPLPLQPTVVPAAISAPPPKKRGKAWLWACGCGCLAALVIGGLIGYLAWKGYKIAEKAISTVTTDYFEVSIPTGWTRETSKETGSTKLFLRGPEVNGQKLVMGVDIYDVDSGTTLTEFSDHALANYRDRTWTEDKQGDGVALCGEEARRVAFTDQDGDNLFYLCLANGRGYVLTLISPKDTMSQEEKTFDEVLQTFDLHKKAQPATTAEPAAKDEKG